MFTAKLYRFTGFNLLNIPDSEATLNAAASSTKDVPAMDTLQLMYQTKITIRAKESDVINVDFLKLMDGESPYRSAFYTVDGYTMTSGDTIELSVSMEPILTAGGINNISKVDGSVTRHHLGKPNVDPSVIDPLQKLATLFNETTIEEDPLLVPSYPSTIRFRENMFQPPAEITEGGNIDSYMPYAVIVFSTIPIDTAINFKYDIPDGNGMVASMGTYSGQMPTNDFIIHSIYEGFRYKTSDYTASSCAEEITVLKTIGDLHQFKSKLATLAANNLTGIITSCYYVPMKWFCNADIDSQSWAQIIAEFSANNFKSPGKYECEKEPISSSFQPWDTVGQNWLSDVIDFVMNGDCSLQPFIGKNNEMIFISTGSGEVRTYNIEELMQDNGKMKFRAVPDPRPHGGVKFAAHKRKSQSYFCDDVIEGGRWIHDSVDSLGRTGYNINNAVFNAQQSAKDNINSMNSVFGMQEGEDSYNWVHGTFKAVSNDLSHTYGYATMTPQEKLAALDNTNPVDPVFNQYQRGIAAGDERIKTLATREYEKQSELAQFMGANAPQPVSVGAAASADMDLYGYGLIWAQRVPDYRDVMKFRSIQSRFGCRHTTLFDKSYFNNRKNFNYIEMTGANVYEFTNSQMDSKQLRQAVSDALNTGLRIWHVAPKTIVGATDQRWANPYKEVT